MNQLALVKAKTESSVPGIEGVIARSLVAEGPSTLDFFNKEGHVLNVIWWPRRGFGLSSPSTHGYGEGVDEMYSTVDETIERVVHLLKTGAETSPPGAITLAQLRERLLLSQKDVATRLRVSQAAVSALEKDLARSQISTVKELLGALGVELELRAILPDRAFTLSLVEEKQMRRDMSTRTRRKKTAR
jgi:DNA-binding XRE family transcriptional regulator